MKLIQREGGEVVCEEQKWHSEAQKQLGRQCSGDAPGPLGTGRLSTILIFISRCATPDD